MSFSPSLSEGAATPNSLTNHDSINDNASTENITNFNKTHLDDEKDIDVLSSSAMEAQTTKIGTSSLTVSTNTMTKTKNTLTCKMASMIGTQPPSLPPPLTSSASGKASKINGKSKLVSNANSNNGEGSYHCQFCDKSFPRLGYLKKHEQVSC